MDNAKTPRKKQDLHCVDLEMPYTQSTSSVVLSYLCQTLKYHTTDIQVFVEISLQTATSQPGQELPYCELSATPTK